MSKQEGEERNREVKTKEGKTEDLMDNEKVTT